MKWKDTTTDEVSLRVTDLCRRWFDRVPAFPALKVLTSHLSSIQPTGHRRSGNVKLIIRPASFDLAMDVVTTKFLSEDKQSRTGLCEAINEFMNELTTSLSCNQDVDLLAALVALPEIADLYTPNGIDSFSVVSMIIDDALSVAVSSQRGMQTINGTTINVNSPSSLIAELVLRLSLRGYATQVARGLVEMARHDEWTLTVQPFWTQVWQDVPVVAGTQVDRILHVVVLEISRVDVDDGVRLLERLLPQSVWKCRTDVQFVMSDKLLTQHTLPPAALSLLLNYLLAQETLGLALSKVASSWGDVSMIRRLSSPHQAALTAALVEGMDLLGKDGFQSQPGLLPTVLQGITNRLESPLPVVQRQGMRLGNALSLCLDPASDPIFGSEVVDLLPDEIDFDLTTPHRDGRDGEVSSSKSSKARKSFRHEDNEEKKKEEGTLTETDSDDEARPASDQFSSDSEFEQYDLEAEGGESDDDDDDKDEFDNAMLQLRDVIKMLRGGENEWRGQLRALKLVGRMIDARPDELSLSAVPLARALLHTQIPTWADEEWKEEEEGGAEKSRLSALVSLTVAVPEPVGIALATELYSPSVDLIQRSRCLAVLSIAAKDLSSSKTSSLHIDAFHEGGGRRQKTERNTVNKFAPVAIPWTAALLKQCDVPGHGIDLFGKDTFLLGRLLVTLGSFLEACHHCAEAVPIAAAVIELVKANNVHNSEEPYVRRAALVAATQVIMAIPPSLVGPGLMEQKRDGAGALVDSIDWLNRWISSVSQSDGDRHCREMANASLNLLTAVTAESLANTMLPENESGIGMLSTRMNRLQLSQSISIEEQQLRMPDVPKIRMG